MSAATFAVVLSDDGRLSLWPLSREIPWGWSATGFVGSKEDCLSDIAQTDKDAASAMEIPVDELS